MADADDLAEYGPDLPHALLWSRWDGLSLAHGGTEILPVAEHGDETRSALEQGIIAEGDRVIGCVGADLLVIPSDPWEDGADVLLVDDEGQRGPYASTVERLVLAAIAESAVIYDDDGEFRDEIFEDESDQYTSKIRRRMLRRRLDMDPDAPLPRFELAQNLAAAGEWRAAATELTRVVELAPNFNWAHHELGCVLQTLADAEQPGQGTCRKAASAHAEAAELSSDPSSKAYFLAWACLASPAGDEREARARQVLALEPNFPKQQEAAVHELIADGHAERAQIHLRLGLAVQPRHLGLMNVRAGQ